MVIGSPCLRATARRLLANVSFLKSLSPQLHDALAAVAVCRRYGQGETIFLEGEPTAGMFIVEQGVVKISKLSTDGREYIMHLVEPGGTFNEVSALDGGPNPANATAFTDAVLWRVDRSDLQRLAKAHPDLAWALIEDLAGRARHLVGLLHDLAMRSVRGRLARLLLEEAQSQATAVVPRYLTQEEMAARLGTVREMVGRTLRSMAAEGIIEFDRHRIVILDPQRLAEEAEV
ncbi:MAG: Crp/Fnr family transcriptional regulator [Caldilineales bacterium]|nr:Crp/Fnr family transcriptional regulator [Caldilineales bacterium]MDW8318637.1 Crp/Fnr family transcriptional regulator [Anaerolineae bacterium]